MKSTILVVDDEQDVLNLVESNLRRAGFDTINAKDGREGLSLARMQQPHLAILDLMLPSLSGLDVCRELKRDAATAALPVIMLTARQEEIDRVVGFEIGVDDYVTKPFSPRELVLRVQAMLRRCPDWRQKPKSAASAVPGVLASRGFTLDYAQCKVFVNGKCAGFSRTEFKLLSVLAERPDHVHSREELLTKVWGYVADIETRTVDMHVLRVREKLGRAAGCLETVRGFGYRILAS